MLRSPWNPAAIFLVLLMAVGSIVMWLGVPLGLIYAASKLSGSGNPSVGPYLLVFIGLPIGMAIVGKLLGYLDRAHSRLTGRADEGPHRASWLKSMRAERTSNRQGGVLDTVMIVSVGLAIVVFAVWFFAFAGSSLPGT
jgi:hypothetical protein